MTELEFAERLKALRKSKNMTQQELADLLGVSNKSVSRWETGGYPDVAMLGPLARALGVTVDDLLGETPPLRALDRADWQNLLSFAFAIGGGVLFFLLNLFTPALVCYLLYLGAMAYGVYLQRHYTYHSRWFHTANLVMNFFVNFRLVTPVVALFSFRLSSLLDAASSDTIAPALWLQAYLPCVVAAAALTLITRAIIQRTNGGALPALSLPRLRRAPFSAAKLLPILIPIITAGFWLLYSGNRSGQPAPLPGWLYTAQFPLFLGLLLILMVLGIVWLVKKQQRWMLIPMLPMCWGCGALFPSALSFFWKYAPKYGRVYYLDAPAGTTAFSFRVPTAELLVAALVLVILYAVCCFIRFEKREKSQ